MAQRLPKALSFCVALQHLATCSQGCDERHNCYCDGPCAVGPWEPGGSEPQRSCYLTEGEGECTTKGGIWITGRLSDLWKIGLVFGFGLVFILVMARMLYGMRLWYKRGHHDYNDWHRTPNFGNSTPHYTDLLYAITLSRPPNDALGITQVEDKKELRIEWEFGKPGSLIERWNIVNPGCANGDRVVEVNGLTEWADMLEQLKAPVMHMKVVRARVADSLFAMSLTKEANMPLGIKHIQGKELLVELGAGSLVERWNRENPGSVRLASPGDRIVQVNSAIAVADMLEQLKTERTLCIKVVRPSTADTIGARADQA